jgi:UDP-N-acetyl-D-mannosaminuronic acid transferase (WecB/TagA/CpsF family)
LCNNLTLCRHLKDNAHLLFDGIAMKLAGRLLGKGWLHDLNGTDLFPIGDEASSKDAVPLYFLGADEFIVARAVQRTRSLCLEYACWI